MDSLKYSYDMYGNIVAIKENGSEIAHYSYDNLSRLIREDNKKLNKTTIFSYDKGGNILEKVEFTYTKTPTNELVGGTRFAYHYPTSGWKDQLLKFNNENFVYDSLGNPTTYRDKTLTWKYGRQLASFENITYKYNADGIRISKTNANNITTHFYLDGTKILAQDNGNILTFKYGIDGVIGFTYQGVGDFYYKKNIFGDIIAIIDKNGQEIAKYAYDAWGNHKSYALNNGSFVDISLETSYTQDGLNNKLIAELNPFRYRGYYFDNETNLYYLNSRYYDPEIGRFINADDTSILSESMNFINGLNLYAYCLNNPVNQVDENGYFISFFIGLLIAAVIGAAVGAVSYSASVVIKGITTGQWEWSWGDLLGSTIGGFIGGAFSIIPGIGSYISAFITGLVSTVLSDAFNHAIYGTEFNFINSIKSGTLNGATSIVFLGIIDTKFAIKGVTFGRGSWSSITDQIYTKFRKDLIKHISWKTFGKMFGLALYESIIDTFKTALA